MKKILNDIKVYKTNNFNELKINKKLPYPFTKEMLNLLKEENKLKQTYYYVESKDNYAFFIIYENKMNIFTFGKLNLFLKLKVIGYPCSLSNCGYVTNNEEFLLEYLKTIKGPKLILNVNNCIQSKDYTIGKTLPTCVLKCDFKNIDDYIESLRSHYKRRINLAIKRCENIKIKESNEDIYDLYLNTYNKSNYKLEKLEKGFFEKVEGTKLVFYDNDKKLGFVLLKKVNKKLIFMLCGMNYERKTADLYYFMLYKIIEYAIKNKCNIIDFGQTSEETKLKFGCYLEEKYFYAHHTNFILNNLVKIGKSLLEYKYNFEDYRVFKEEK